MDRRHLAGFFFTRFPEWHTRDKVRYFQKTFWKKICRADHIIFLSEFIREESIHIYGFAGDRSTVIYPGFDREIFKPFLPADLLPLRRQYNLPPKLIPFVGSIEPRKNLKKLLQAYWNLDPDLRKDYKLVLAGFKGWENQEIMTLTRELKKDVFYIGYLPDTDLGKIYGLAELFVYSSYYEGFTLPPRDDGLWMPGSPLEGIQPAGGLQRRSLLCGAFGGLEHSGGNGKASD